MPKKNKPDSSKDLEKDKREWTPEMQRAAKAYGQSLYESHLGYGERLWLIFDAAEVVPKARLQQVEAELVSAKVAIDAIFEERDHLHKIIAEKDLIIKVSEQHTQYWEDKCAE